MSSSERTGVSRYVCRDSPVLTLTDILDDPLLNVPYWVISVRVWMVSERSALNVRVLRGSAETSPAVTV